jgi:hypothetical protein
MYNSTGDAGVNPATDLRISLVRNGYQPVPVSAPWVKVQSAGKRPLLKNWRQICAGADEETIRLWETELWDSTNTGILTNSVRAIDIDVYDADLAAKLLDLAVQHFGPTPLLRSGQAPKILGVWAAADDFSKIDTKAYRLPSGLTARIEILAIGQQFVAFGEHPDTKAPYQWHGDSPLDVLVCELETISADAAKFYRDAAEKMIVQAGGVLISPPKAKAHASPQRSVSLSDIAEGGWARAALDGEYDAVTNAPEGERNDTLNRAAFNLGQLVGADHLKENDVIEVLTQAAEYVGLDDRESIPTIRSGLKAGIAQPRDPKPREDRAPARQPAAKTNAGAVTSTPADSDTDLHPYDLFGDTDLTGTPKMPDGCVPDVIQAFARDEGERLGVDPAMVATGCIVACAAVTNDQWKVQPKQFDYSWKESARLWLCMIAPPSAKKTPVLKAVTEPLCWIDQDYADADAELMEQYEVDLKVYTKKMDNYSNDKAKNKNVPQPLKPIRPPSRRLVVNDANVPKLTDILQYNPNGVICIRDELASWFASMNNKETGAKDRADWLSAYNGGSYVVDRIQRGSVRIPNWSACLIGTIQPDKLNELCGKMTDDGLMQRFMLIHAEPSGRGVDRAPNDAVIGNYHSVIRVLKDMLPDQGEGVIMLSEEAQAERTTLLDIIDLVMALPDSPEQLRSHLGKWDGLFARLCLTFHMIEMASAGQCPDPVISSDTAQRVIAFMRDLLLPNLMKFYRDLYSVSQKIEHARWIAGYIIAHAKTKVTRREIYRSYTSKLRDDPRIMNDAMHLLDLANWVTPVDSKNGRDVTEWRINPLVHSVFAQRAADEKARREAVKATIAALSDEAKRLKIKVKAA